MDRIFQICAAVGGTLIVCQFLMSLLGLGGEHGDDAGGGHDMAGHGHGHGPGDEHGSAWVFGKLTLRTIAAGLAFFGLTGMAARKSGVDDVAVVVLAVAAGLGAFFVVSWTIQLMSRFNMDGTVRIEQAYGHVGKVYVAIPGELRGAGKVFVEVAGRTIEYKAQTAGAPLATGTPVRVVDILGHDTVEVAPIVDPSPTRPDDGGEFRSDTARHV